MGNFNIKSFLNNSERLRKGYLKSLEEVDNQFEEKLLRYCGKVPRFIYEIYSICNGTKPDIDDQRYFDFIPGYRLMQINEIVNTNLELDDLCMETIIPFLKDYSSNYIIYAKSGNNEYIVSVSSDGNDILHDSTEKFWETIISFYTEKVYYLDHEGYLSYDFDLEGSIGRRINKNIIYWN